jgi:hypothetical protein
MSVVFRKAPFTEKVDCVCEPCNNRWMNNLETDVQSSLKPILVGEAQQLDEDALKTIASWVVLRALVFQYTHPRKLRAAPPAHYEWMYERRERSRREPPPHTWVWIGAYAEGTDAPGYQHQGLADERELPDAEFHGYSTTLTVGHLVAHVIGFKGTVEDGDFRDGPRVQRLFLRCWPIRDSTLMWPPTQGFGRQGVANLGSMFGGV